MSQVENAILLKIEQEQRILGKVSKTYKFHAECSNDYCQYYRGFNDDRCKYREVKKQKEKVEMAMVRQLDNKENKRLALAGLACNNMKEGE